MIKKKEGLGGEAGNKPQTTEAGCFLKKKQKQFKKLPSQLLCLSRALLIVLGVHLFHLLTN